jgi:hypothetical protein
MYLSRPRVSGICTKLSPSFGSLSVLASTLQVLGSPPCSSKSQKREVYFCCCLCLVLARQALYHLSHCSSPFVVGYFSNRVSHFCLGLMWTAILLSMPLMWLGLQKCTPWLACLLRPGLAYICWGWLQTAIHSVSASKVFGKRGAF